MEKDDASSVCYSVPLAPPPSSPSPGCAYSAVVVSPPSAGSGDGAKNDNFNEVDDEKWTRSVRHGNVGDGLAWRGSALRCDRALLSFDSGPVLQSVMALSCKRVGDVVYMPTLDLTMHALNLRDRSIVSYSLAGGRVPEAYSGVGFTYCCGWEQKKRVDPSNDSQHHPTFVWEHPKGTFFRASFPQQHRRRPSSPSPSPPPSLRIDQVGAPTVSAVTSVFTSIASALSLSSSPSPSSPSSSAYYDDEHTSKHGLTKIGGTFAFALLSSDVYALCNDGGVRRLCLEPNSALAATLPSPPTQQPPSWRLIGRDRVRVPDREGTSIQCGGGGGVVACQGGLVAVLGASSTLHLFKVAGDFDSPSVNLKVNGNCIRSDAEKGCFFVLDDNGSHVEKVQWSGDYNDEPCVTPISTVKQQLKRSMDCSNSPTDLDSPLCPCPSPLGAISAQGGGCGLLSECISRLCKKKQLKTGENTVPKIFKDLHSLNETDDSSWAEKCRKVMQAVTQEWKVLSVGPEGQYVRKHLGEGEAYAPSESTQ